MKDLVDTTERDELYEYSYYSHPSYSELIDSFELPILIQEHDHDYQGDSYYLFQDGKRYGILIFGWGSCSGCDALQACDSYEEVVRLRDELFDGIKWFDNKQALEDYVAVKDWETEWYSHRDAGKAFTRRIKEFCGFEYQPLREE